MTAIRITSFGELSKLQITKVSKPALGFNEALIRVKAASINLSDVKEVKGLMPHVILPRITGRDYSGIVEEGPSEWIGKEVWGTGGDLGFTRDGSHSTFLIVNADSLRLKPTILTAEQAAAVGVNFVTAWTGLEVAGLAPGKDVLIVGANGQVGAAAIQIAKWQGARKVIGTVRKEVKDLLERTGADRIINTTEGDVKEQVYSEFGNKGADVIFDTVGAPTFLESLSLLANNGKISVISTPPQSKTVNVDIFDFYRRSLTLTGVNTLLFDHLKSAEILDKLLPGFQSKQLKPSQELLVLSLSEAVLGFESTEKGTKVILKPE